MTSIIGVLCADGVVIGSDGSTTLTQGDSPIIEQPAKKISIIDEKLIIAGTGMVGLDQRFKELTSIAWSKKIFSKSKIPDLTQLELCRKLSAMTIKNFSETGINPGLYGSLLGFIFNNKPFLCEFDIKYFQPELKTNDIWFSSMGCAQHITDTMLSFFKNIFSEDEPPSLSNGIFYTLWALQHAVEVNPGGVNYPIDISVIQSKNDSFQARFLDDPELDEHRQNIAEAKKVFLDYRESFSSDSDEIVQKIPKP